MSRYTKNAGAVFALKAHLVWCPKYRRPVLVGAVESRLKELIHQIAAEYEWTVEGLEIMPDHVHLFLQFDPRFSIADIANRLKGTSSRALRDEFPALRSRLPTLWSRSYYAGTVGNVSEATIRRYIAEQKGK